LKLSGAPAKTKGEKREEESPVSAGKKGGGKDPMEQERKGNRPAPLLPASRKTGASAMQKGQEGKKF